MVAFPWRTAQQAHMTGGVRSSREFKVPTGKTDAGKNAHRIYYTVFGTLIVVTTYSSGRTLGAAGGSTHLLLALVIGPLTTHPFRNGAPAPTPNRDTINIWALSAFFQVLLHFFNAYIVPFMFRLLWPPSIS